MPSGSGVKIDAPLVPGGGVQLAKLLAGDVDLDVDPEEHPDPDKFAEKPLLTRPLAVGVVAVRFSSTVITFVGVEYEARVSLFVLLNTYPLPPP